MQQFSHISVADVAAKKEQLTLVDIRDPQSFQQGHIEGAIHLTNDTLPAFLKATDKSQPIAVVCYHGNSSQQAAQFLVEQGFEQVSSMDGGFEAWRLNMPVVSADS
jgi:thiosulfate sulfurtransferase